ncbi:MAG: hypothetical protein AAFV49_19410 [Pseudomonadota bacterium]
MISALRAEPSAPYRIETVVLLVWASLYLTGLYFHEPWRDEVRAYSLMREGGDPVGIFLNLRNEGHPVLWYWVLWLVDQVVDNPLSLKVAAAGIGFATTAVILFRLPLPLALRVAIVFSFLSLHSMHIVARNYGISVLLMMLFVDSVLRHPNRHWQQLLLLALFVNTNLYALLMTPMIAAAVRWPEIRAFLLERDLRALRLLAIYGVVLAVAAAVAYAAGRTDETTRVLGSNLRVLDYGNGSLTVGAVVEAYRGAFSHVDLYQYYGIDVDASKWLKRAMFAGFVLSLLASARYFVPGIFCLFAFMTVSGLVYAGSNRHAIMLSLVLLTLFILARARVLAAPPSWQRHVVHGATLFWIVALVAASDVKSTYDDIKRQFTGAALAANAAMARDEQRDIIAFSEAHTFIDALPYYMPDARIYQVREGEFRDFTLITNAAVDHLSLGDLIDAAERLQAEHADAGVYLFTKTYLEGENTSGGQDLGFGFTFSWEVGELQRLRERFDNLGRFEPGIYGDERLTVYRLKN